MFKNIELLNGPRDPYHMEALEKIIGSLTRQKMELWANKYDLEPIDWDPRKGYTGGSDDHSGIAIARAYTTFEGPKTVDGLFGALAAMKTRTDGEFMTPVSAAHNIYSGVVQYYVHRKEEVNQQSIYDQVYKTIASKGAALADMGPMDQLLQSPLGRVIMALQEVRMDTHLPTWQRMLEEGDKESFHVEVNKLAMRITSKAFSNASEELVDAVGRLDLDGVVKVVPAILQMLLLHLPYYIGFRYFYQDRRRADALHQSIEVGYVPKAEMKVAIFSDTLDDVNGVTLGLRRMIRELREQGRKVYLVGLNTESVGSSAKEMDQWADEEGAEAVIRFDPLTTFNVPGYDHMPLGLPPVLQMMQWCVENHIDLIQASTPGPVGVAAVSISKMLGAPIVGHYHTQVPEYAERLLGDKTLSGIVRAFVSGFYGSLDKVIVPSRATYDNLVAMGLRPERLEILSRGVDTKRFTPNRRDTAVWKQYGLNGVKKLLYVGRISKEKNLDALLDSYEVLRGEGVGVELAIVGDGPYKNQLKERLPESSGVTFTGYVGGEELPKLFASADLFVFPSATDTFGNVVLEAQASSLPVIVTDEGGPAELMIPGRTGMIVPAKDGGALQDAIRRLVKDDDLRQSMGDEARRHVSKMSHDRAASELWDFYHTQIESDRQKRTGLVKRGI
jgi:glycosyltransferase involved in cell wall biosynthesis